MGEWKSQFVCFNETFRIKKFSSNSRENGKDNLCVSMKLWESRNSHLIHGRMEKTICVLCVLASRYFMLLRENKTTVTIKAIGLIRN